MTSIPSGMNSRVWPTTVSYTHLDVYKRQVVTGGHHADCDADPRLAGLVGVEEIGRAEQIVVGEIDRVLLRIGNQRSDLHREIGLVFAGPERVGQLVEDLRQLGGVALTDGCLLYTSRCV